MEASRPWVMGSSPVEDPNGTWATSWARAAATRQVWGEIGDNFLKAIQEYMLLTATRDLNMVLIPLTQTENTGGERRSTLYRGRAGPESCRQRGET